jgi:hypothetical protein
MSNFSRAFQRLQSRWIHQLFGNRGTLPGRRSYGLRKRLPLIEALESRQLLSAAVFPEIDVRGNGQSIVDGDSTPSVTDFSDFGSADIQGGLVTRTFTIANSGAGALNLTGASRVKLSGTNAADFSVTALPTATISALTGSSTFSVRFDPSASGARNATLTIYNDDDDENPYNFDITGTGGTAPEIDVRGNNVSILTGDVTPATADWTDFGSAETAAGTVSRVFTIKNTGSGALTLSGTPLVDVTGGQAADFTVSVAPASSVAAAGTTTFTVVFDPSATGARNATLTIANDDANEGTYTFNIKGTGVNLPDINLQGNSVTIAQNDSTPSGADDTDFGSVEVVGATQAKTYTIQNLGSAALNFTGTPIVKVGGANVADFVVTTQPSANNIASAGADLTFVVTFNPSASGVRYAILSIGNNASKNPFKFTIQGTGTTTPEIAVHDQAAVDITVADASPGGTARDFGNADTAGGTATKTFTILNLGSSALSLSGSPKVTLSAGDTGDFSISTQPSLASVPVAGSTTFVVTFDPTASGARTATLSITNNDPDGGEAPFTFDITGTGTTAPEMNLKGNSISIVDGDTTPTTTDHTDFGGADVTGATVVRTFTIENIGSANLTLGGTPLIDVTGADAADFVVDSSGTSDPIAAAGTTTFTVTFDPSGPGIENATISIANNDSDENPYTFDIQGTGTANVEIALTGNAAAIVDNSVTPSGTNDTDFGSRTIGVNTITKTFTITNTGSDGLDLTGTPLIDITGTNASDFTVTVDPDASVAAGGGTTTFDVTFDPQGTGTRLATITILNTDTDEGTYTFDIQGTGVAVPEIDVQGQGISIIGDGSNTAGSSDDTDFTSTVEITSGSVTHTFTIQNLGSGLLTLSGTPKVAVDDTTNYTVIQPSAGTLQPNGGSLTFQVVFDPTTAAVHAGVITISNDDANEGTYTFNITGTGISAPEADVFGKGQMITSGDASPGAFDDTDFGLVERTTGTVTHTFSVKNSGTSDLTLSGTPLIDITGANAADFTVVTQPGATVTAGNAATFDIIFDPGAAGLRTALVTIVSDDSNEGTYTFAIQGTGVTAPRIGITGNTVAIANGDTSPRPADFTDFAGVDIGSASLTRTFTINNTGSGTLNLSGSPRVTITGTDAASFAIVTQPGATVAPSLNTTFQLRFAPDTLGFKTATIRITNNDLVDGAFHFDVSGIGVSNPTIDVRGNNNSIAAGDTTPTTTDWTDFGTTDVSGGTINKTFTIRNPGSAALTLTGSPLVSLTGTNAADFTVTTQPTSPVAASAGTTTFVVRFDPSGGGDRNATVNISSDDPNQPAFAYAIHGTGQVASTIGVIGNSIAIVNGANPLTTNFTDFGNIEVANGTLVRTFTINNTGSSVLRLTGSPKVAISGAGAADYSITQVPATRVAAISGTTTFQVTFNPSAASARVANLTIANNDAANPSFVVKLTGTGVNASDMDVQGNSVSIPKAAATPTLANHTDFGAIDIASATVVRTFTVENRGAGALNFAASNPRVAVSGTNAADFSVTAQLPASVTATDGAPGGTDQTTFQVTFNPSAAGLRIATLSIANNDPNKNPYTFSIKGTGTTTPEIDVKGNSVSIVNADSTPSGADFTQFSNAEINTGSVTRTFTIFNTGSGALTLSGSPLVAISGTDAADFTVTVLPTATVAATSGTTTFQVKFDPTTAGTKDAVVTIANNDSDEGPYTFSIEGAGTLASEDTVYGNSVLIANGKTAVATADSTDFGSASLGATVIKTFTVKNTGSAALGFTGSKVTVTANGVAAGSGDFTVSTMPVDDPVAANNGTTTYAVSFTPTATGARQAKINVLTDDADDATYTYVVQGTGLNAPEINIQGNSASIVDGDSTPSGADFTDFGNADIALGTVNRTFTIQNTGAAALTISGSPLVRIVGTNAADFTVTALPGASVAAAGTTTFIVRFDPTAAGVRSATVNITNNDGNEALYDFAIQGTGTTAPEIDVQGGTTPTSIVIHDVTPAVVDGTDFGTVETAVGVSDHSFTIKNLGSEALNLDGVGTRVVITGANAADYTIVNLPRGSIAPGGTATLDVEFDPSGTGARVATITINSDDSDEAAFDFAVTGLGANQPEIDVQGNGASIVKGDVTPNNNDLTAFGTVSATGGSFVHTFTILNNGSADLTLSGSPKVIISGTNAADFTVNVLPASPVTAGSNTTFQITFDPTTNGVRTATVSITNNDTDEGTYTFTINGTGT